MTFVTYMFLCAGTHMHMDCVHVFRGQRTSLAVVCWLLSHLCVCFFVRVSHETGTHAGSMLAGQLHGSSGLPLSFQIVCAITLRL